MLQPRAEESRWSPAERGSLSRDLLEIPEQGSPLLSLLMSFLPLVRHMKEKMSTHMQAEISLSGKRTGKEKLGVFNGPVGGGVAGTNCSQFEQVQLKAAVKEVM